MAKGREFYRQQAEEELPEATRRPLAPKPRKTRTARRAVKKATSWKLPPDTKPAIDRAATKYGVERGELVDFLLRAGLHLLATDKIKPPVVDNQDAGPRYRIEPQPIPDEFKE